MYTCIRLSAVRLSKHFTKAELACKCCGFFNMEPPFIAFLEKVRREVDEPMVITSGVRCPANNKKSKGSPTSAHLSGLAVDVAVSLDAYRMKLVGAAVKYGATGIGIYSGWVHLDLKDRVGKAMWVK